MKTLLFLDDWFLDARVDVVRHLVRPQLVREIIPPKGTGYPPRVLWHPGRQCYQTTLRYETARPLFRESEDGVTWHSAPAPSLEFGRITVLPALAQLA